MGKEVQKSFFWIVLVILVAGMLSSYLQDKSTGEAVRTSRSIAPSNLIISPIAPATCSMPPRPPQTITQSMTLCSGTYPHGIIIGADNMQVTCQPNTIFDGIAWNGLKGLSIIGKSNIELIGCSFRNFAEDGMYIVGQQNALARNIKIINSSSINNTWNGLYLGSNTRDIVLSGSVFSQNRVDGIILTSQYISGSGGGIPLLFPNTITVDGNRITSNVQHGIHLDAFAYYPSYPPENNPLMIQKNIIFNNGGDGIRNIGFTSGSGGDKSYIMDNRIHVNRGSGISIIGAKISTIPYPISIDVGFDYIISNDIIINGLVNGISREDGISIKLPMFNPPMNAQTNVRLYADNIFANVIVANGRHGISFTNEVNAPNLFHLTMFSKIYQNMINWNHQKGIYASGLDQFAIPFSMNDINKDIRCNDIISNTGNGIQIGEFSSGIVRITEKNIIEQNTIGVLLFNLSSTNAVVYQNDISSNSLEGLDLNGSTTNARVTYNDFDQNFTQQAFDIDSNVFDRNWWSDYSPTCLDQPPNGWCDISRPVPSTNNDMHPKAGTSWGWKNRGYFATSAQGAGVQINPSCSIIQLPINNSVNYTGTGQAMPLEPGEPGIGS